MRLMFNKTLEGFPLLGATSFRNLKNFDVCTSTSLKSENNFIYENQIMDNTAFLKTVLLERLYRHVG